MGNVRFEFNADTLDPRAIPNDYEMVDGEIFDAFILPQMSITDKSQSNKTKQINFDENSND